MAGKSNINSRIKELSTKLQRYLDDDHQTKAKQQKTIKKVLRKLKKRQNELEAGLKSASPDGEEFRTTKKHIAVVRAMRKKGLQALKDSREQTG
jgi:indole-3-glycerol phosphate synthase